MTAIELHHLLTRFRIGRETEADRKAFTYNNRMTPGQFIDVNNVELLEPVFEVVR